MADVAVIYCRVSSRVQEEDGTSLDSQEQFARDYCQEHGYSVLEPAHKDVHTGADLWERRGLSDAVKLIRDGKATVLIAYALDRLSRDINHQGALFVEIQQAGGRIEIVTEKLDDSPTGTILRVVSGVVAQIERGKIGERTTRGRHSRAEKGKILVGPSPLYGYKWDNPAKGERGGYVIDDEAAPIVRRLFETVANGGSVTGLVRDLNRDGVETASQLQYRRGCWPRNREIAPYWNGRQVRNVLNNPAYKGEHTAFRRKFSKDLAVSQKTGKRTRHTPLRDENDPVRVALPASACPAIVSPETWEQVRRQLAVNQARAVKNNHSPENTLLRGGFILCGYCGRPMTVTRRQLRSGDRSYVWRYRCTSIPKRYTGAAVNCTGGTHTIPASAVDNAIWQRLKVLLTPGLLRAVIEDAQENRDQDGLEAHIAAHEKVIASWSRQHANYVTALGKAEDEDTIAALTAAMEHASRERAKAAQELASLKASAAQRADYSRFLEDMEHTLDWFKDRWDTLSYVDKQRWLDAVGLQVFAYRSDWQPEMVEKDGQRVRADGLDIGEQWTFTLFGGRSPLEAFAANSEHNYRDDCRRKYVYSLPQFAPVPALSWANVVAVYLPVAQGG